MRILVAGSSEHASYALAAIDPRPRIVAITCVTPHAAERFARDWGLRHAQQHLEGAEAGKALFWHPALAVTALGREQRYERCGHELKAIRGALVLALNYQSENVQVYCVRCGPDPRRDEMSAAEIAALAARSRARFVIALEDASNLCAGVASLQDAGAAAPYACVLVGHALSRERVAAQVFGALISKQTAEQTDDWEATLAEAFACASRLYCSPGWRVARTTYFLDRPAIAQGREAKLRVAASYDLALTTASSASSRTHASASLRSKSSSAQQASEPPSSPSPHAA